MPPFHIHFREEMQEAVRYLYEAYAGKSLKTQIRAARNAQNYVQGCLSGLHGHVGIEEHHIFPVMQRHHPKINLQFLFQDHQRLDRKERQLTRELNQLVRSATSSSSDSLIPREDIMEVLRLLLAFDTTLMTHLGEEEEVVVPISLSSGGAI
jgi:hemerythrin-like domain-containing protein